jgi:hypothetical protein
MPATWEGWTAIGCFGLAAYGGWRAFWLWIEALDYEDD